MTAYVLELAADNPHHAEELARVLASEAARRWLEEHGVVVPKEVKAVAVRLPEPEDMEPARG